MLNITGAFVVIFTDKVEPHLLGAKAVADYYERVAIVGFLKTNQFTFGGDALAALPCTEDCMTTIALNYPDTEPMAKQVKAICARIALGQPLGDDSGPQGGLGILANHAKPKTPRSPSGARVKAPIQTAAQ